MLWCYESRNLDERQLLENMHISQPIIVTNQNEKIVGVNLVWVDMCKFTAEEAFGRRPEILQGPLTNRETALDFSLRLRGGQSAFASIINYKKDGSMFTNHLFGYMLGDLLIAETYAEDAIDSNLKTS